MYVNLPSYLLEHLYYFTSGYEVELNFARSDAWLTSTLCLCVFDALFKILSICCEERDRDRGRMNAKETLKNTYYNCQCGHTVNTSQTPCVDNDYIQILQTQEKVGGLVTICDCQWQQTMSPVHNKSHVKTAIMLSNCCSANYLL